MDASISRQALSQPVYYSTASALARAIRSGELTSEAVVTACLERIEAVNGMLNAVVQLDGEQALAQAGAADRALARGDAAGPLHGVPMTIKDSLDTAGMISTGGTLGRAAFVPGKDATVVRRLRDAGAVLMGKTNTPELTLSFDTNNRVYGQTFNPHDLSRSPGGSSGGAAAIVAAGGSPFDIGSDYGGSIRLPAHVNGICGLKPTAGRVSRSGHIFPFGGVQDAFQQLGPLARGVEDLALLLRIIQGPDGIDPGALPLESHDPDTVDLSDLRVAWFDDNGIAEPTPETREAVRVAARSLAEGGIPVSSDRPGSIGQTLDVTLPIYFWDGGASVRRLLRAYGTTEHTLSAITGSEALTAEQFDAAHARLDAWRSEMLSFLDRYDVLLCPVNAHPAFRPGAGADPEMMAWASYAFTFNATGWPAVVVPVSRSADGLPIGIQVVAGPGREDRALAVAGRIERLVGGYQRPSLA
ncbi:amidase [Wenzhouxiangellaceae bacterium CH-27]|uniref:Amidase n=2 Tax=Elongatibacter sediminis TaxID=3119006 RepID=A0AAW9RBZ8_9GAMM